MFVGFVINIIQLRIEKVDKPSLEEEMMVEIGTWKLIGFLKKNLIYDSDKKIEFCCGNLIGNKRSANLYKFDQVENKKT